MDQAEDEIQCALLRAWQRIAPTLAQDEAELRHRLARRRSATLQRPPRPWCIAIRASDTRLDKFRVHRSDFRLPTSHSLLLDSAAIKQLIKPIHLDKPGEPLDDVAHKLGTTRTNLLDA